MKTLFALLFLVVMRLDAQTSLEAFIHAAEQNNPQLKEYANQLSTSSLQKELIRAQRLPQISLSAGYLFAPFFNNNGHFVSVDPSPQAIGYDIGITNGGMYSAQVNVEKSLFNGGVSDALNESQSIQEETIRHSSVLAHRDIVKQVTEQYLQTYEAKKLYELSTETAGTMKELLAIVGALVEHGVSKQTEYLQLSIEYENKTIAVSDALLAYKTNINQLNTICGIADAGVAQIDSVSLTLHGDASGFTFTKKYELDSLSALAQQRIAETKYQPQVGVFFNTGLNAVELANIDRKFGLSAGVNLSIPLFDGNQRSITRQQNELSLQSIANYRETFATQVKNQRKNSLDKIEHLKSTLASLTRQMEGGYDRLIRITEGELRQGHVSMIEYLTVLRNYLDLKREKINVDTDVQREINTYNYWN